jgi:hypothetical protein
MATKLHTRRETTRLERGRPRPQPAQPDVGVRAPLAGPEGQRNLAGGNAPGHGQPLTLRPEGAAERVNQLDSRTPSGCRWLRAWFRGRCPRLSSASPPGRNGSASSVPRQYGSENPKIWGGHRLRFPSLSAPRLWAVLGFTPLAPDVGVRAPMGQVRTSFGRTPSRCRGRSPSPRPSPAGRGGHSASERSAVACGPTQSGLRFSLPMNLPWSAAMRLSTRAWSRFSLPMNLPWSAAVPQASRSRPVQCCGWSATQPRPGSRAEIAAVGEPLVLSQRERAGVREKMHGTPVSSGSLWHSVSRGVAEFRLPRFPSPIPHPLSLATA